MEKLIRCGFYDAFVYYINQNQDQANVKTLQDNSDLVMLVPSKFD